MIATEPLSYEARLILAYAECALMQERCNGFFSNDGALDAAENWTTSDMEAIYALTVEDADFVADDTDYGQLVTDLTAAIWPDAAAEGGY